MRLPGYKQRDGDRFPLLGPTRTFHDVRISVVIRCAKRTLSKLLALQADFTRANPYVAVLALVDRAALIASSLISLRATSKLQWI